MTDLWLHPGRDRSVRRRHPWLLSGAVERVEGDPVPGAWVRVRASSGDVVGWGHYSPVSTLRVRMLAFGPDASEEEILEDLICRAVNRRGSGVGIGETDALRLVNAEADGLPGLVADRYGDVVVVKLQSAGMAARRARVAEALRNVTDAAAGYERADTATARREGIASEQGALWGAPPEGPITIRERKRVFRVDVRGGQKTGFYLDQRDARDLTESVSAGRRVLDLFAYTGAFSVAAALGAARSATLVDSSPEALDLARENLVANAPDFPARIERADAFRFVRADTAEYDLIVVDPPPLARNRRDTDRAARAQKDVLLHALRRAAPGALVLAFSCSHHVGPDRLRKIVFGASLDAGRPVQVLRSLGAPVDHPVSIDHPEGEYLTGLLLRA